MVPLNDLLDRRIPACPGWRARDPGAVVVIVPGLTGSALRECGTGSMVWSRGEDLLAPHDDGYRLARPISACPQPTGDLEATEVIDYLRFGPFRKRVLGPIAELLVRLRLRRGEFGNPPIDGDFFLFAYDWRQDNVHTAKCLHRALQALRLARGCDRLRVVLIGQSNGVHICRYLLKYGDADLDMAIAGRARQPSDLDVVRMILIGSATGGSLRTLRELHRGRRYLPWIGRRIAPETMFSFVALLQDLPAYREDFFIDDAARPVEVDLFDADAWERYGWSVFAPGVRARLDRRVAEKFGTARERRVYLDWALTRARNLHYALRMDPEGFRAPVYHLIQNAYLPTPDRAVLYRDGNSWEIGFTGDRTVRRMVHLDALVTTGGDGHASRESQLFLSPAERAALITAPFYTDRPHFRLAFGSTVLGTLMRYLGWDAAEPGNE